MEILNAHNNHFELNQPKLDINSNFDTNSRNINKSNNDFFNLYNPASTEKLNNSIDYSEKFYLQRLESIKLKLNEVNWNDIQMNCEDYLDESCDSNKPVRVTFNDVHAATNRIRGGIEVTPCTRSHMCSSTGIEIYFKKDFLQYTGSFKERGARNALLNLSQSQRANGVIAASAGNHALALCYHGKMLRIPVVVVMPKIAPIMKISNCRSYGAIVIIEGANLAEAKNHAFKIRKLFNLMYINGYDHPHILAGQGSMGLEIIEQVPDVDAIVIPTGGGGLLAGIAVAAKSINPNIQIIAVESERCPSFYNSYINGKPTFTKAESTLADGLSVSLVGYNAYATAAPLVNKCVCVSEEFISIAILRLLELEKAVVEGAGACGLAAILQGILPELKNKKVVIPICGGNIDTSVLGRVLERALVADSRLIKVSVTISDRPGSLMEFCKLITSKGASIKDINQERAWLKNDIFSVQVQVVLEVADLENAKEIEEVIRQNYHQVFMGSCGV